MTAHDSSAPPNPPARPRVFLRLFWMLRPQWGMIALALLCLILSLPGELFPAFVWMYVVDHLVLHNPNKTLPLLVRLFSFDGAIVRPLMLLLSAVTWMLCVYLFSEALGTLSSNLMQRAAQKFILRFRNSVYGKLQDQSLAYLQRQRLGDLMARAMGDVDELQSFIVGSIDVIVGDGILWLGTVVLVMLMDWRVASISLAPLIVVYFLLRVFNRIVAPIYKTARDRLGDVSTRLQENLAGVVVIKIFGREREEAARFRDTTDRAYREQIRLVNARSVLFPVARGVGFFSNVFMIGVGGYSILTGGSFTVGMLLAFRAYWWRLFGPIQTLARVNDMIMRAGAAGKRIFEVLDAPQELPDAPDAIMIDHVRGEMELRSVTFSYGAESPSGADRRPVSSDAEQNHALAARATTAEPHNVLHDVSILIEPGRTVALCGPSGGGKSTILNLLVRFYDPTEGSVTLDGRDLHRIARDSLRRHFALVQQETFLFNDSILDNIRYGHADATFEQVIAATKAANAHGFITRLPNGYDTRVGERGVRLSGGQKQRISIARAFLANPAILLLDEPTSSVEPDSESAIIAALDRLMQDRTTILTSHRPSLIMQADKVYVVEDGRVTDQGSPQLLAQNGGWFARFIRSATEPASMDADTV